MAGNSLRARYCWRSPVIPVATDLAPSSPPESVNHPCFLCLVSSEYGRCEKIFWSFAATCLFLVVSFISFNLVLSYIRRPITISVDNIDGTLQGATFPAVTICNLNWRHLSVEWLVSRETRQEHTWIMLPANLTLIDTNGTGIENVTEPATLLTNMTLLRNVTITQHEKAHMILRCTWRSELINCSDVFQSVVTEMGVCSAFNYAFPEKALKGWYDNNHKDRKLLEVGGVGRHNGLGILLDAKEGRHLQEWDAIGFKVVVHPPQEVPLESRAFLVSPGTLTSANIHVSQTMTSEAVMNQWPARRNKNCYGDNEQELQHYSFYSEANCFMECVRDAIFEECQCVLPAIPADDDENSTSICILKEQNDCARRIVDSLQVSAEEQYENRRQRCQCKRRCSSIKYDTTVSIAKFPGNHALRRLSKEHNKTEEYIRNNLVELEIFFSDASYIKYTRDVSSSVLQLFGNVGGIIGGVLGCSLVTVCDFLFLVTRWRWRKKRNFFRPPKIQDSSA